MTSLEQELTELLTPAVNAVGYELLGLEFIRAGKNSVLRIYIDHEDGITVDDCAEVSTQVSALLDVEDPITVAYNLEISSPGVERPLFRLEHYAAFIGESLYVSLNMAMNNRRKFNGKLIAVEGNNIVLDVDNQSMTIAFTNINKAHLLAQLSMSGQKGKKKEADK